MKILYVFIIDISIKRFFFKVKVKVQFIRNLTNDDHFDLTDKRKLLGKTIAYFSRDANNSELISLKILGNILYKKFGRVCDALQTIIDNDRLQLDETIVRKNRISYHPFISLLI